METHLGYSEEEAVLEADRCLRCGDPACVDACPLLSDVKGMIEDICNKDFAGAAERLRETNVFLGTTARVCPQLGGLCESACRMKLQGDPVSVGLLQRFVADWERDHSSYRVPEVEKNTGKTVAIIGAGPAGIAAADLLTRYGHSVVLYDELDRPGGTAMYAIPDYHLPKDVLEYEIECVKKMGVRFVMGVKIGRDISLQELLAEEFDTILLSTGCADVTPLEAPGVDLEGVYDAYAFLKQVFAKGLGHYLSDPSSIRVGKKVVVVGGGNTAVDAARTALRVGGRDVRIIYRRSEKEMPADPLSVEDTKEEGIKIEFLTQPIAFHGKDRRVERVEYIRMRLGEPDSSGRRRPVPIDGSNFTIEVDTVLAAIGRGPNTHLPSKEGIRMEKWGGISVDPKTMQTSIPRVYAAGDVVNGETLVCKAMASGREAAQRIHEALMKTEPISLYKKYFDGRYFDKRVRLVRRQSAHRSQNSLT